MHVPSVGDILAKPPPRNQPRHHILLPYFRGLYNLCLVISTGSIRHAWRALSTHE